MSTTTTPTEALKPITVALPSLSPSLAVEVLPYGFTIHKILVNADGKTHDIVIAPNDPEDHYKERKFFNTIVGRYSNRVPVGEYDLNKDGATSHLSVKATESPRVQLHGGADGFDRRVFEVVEPSQTSSYELFSETEKALLSKVTSGAIFKLTSPSGDEGYPGLLKVEVLLLLLPSAATTVSPEGEHDLGSLSIVYRAKVEEEAGKKVVTPVNLTQHWAFNLDASLAGENQPTPDILPQILSIKSGNTIALHEDFLATGELVPITEDSHHNHKAKPIGEKILKRGYDEFYLFNEDPVTGVTPRTATSLDSLNVLADLSKATSSSPPVELSSKKTGLRLAFETNQRGVQFYTANGNDGSGSRKKIHGGTGERDTGDGYRQFAGAFLEFHEPLAAWLHSWASGGDTLLTSDQIYNNWTKVSIYHKPT